MPEEPHVPDGGPAVQAPLPAAAPPGLSPVVAEVGPAAPERPATDDAPERRRLALRERHRVVLRRARRVLGIAAVVVAGSAVGSALAPDVTTQVGPIEAAVRVVPSLEPGVQLLLPPAGRVDFRTHLAPVAVQARIESVDLEGARALIASPAQLRRLQELAPDDLRTATLQAAGTTVACCLAGAVGLSLLVYRRRWRRTAQVAAGTAAALVLTSGVLAATFDSDRFAQPRFTGLLSQAPYVAGQASSMVRRLESYRSGLADILQGVTSLYATSGRLPVVPGDAADDVVTVLHISDIHLNPLGFDLTDRLVKQFDVDLVIDTGDITTWGTEVESSTLARVGQVGVPYVFVRGNHDSLRTQRAVAANRNARVLDGDVVDIDGLVIAGLGDPRFTPDTAGPPLAPRAGPQPPAVPTVPSPAASPSGSAVPSTEVSPLSPTTVATEDTPSPSPTGSAAADPLTAALASPDVEVRAGARLTRVIRDWNERNPDRPVAVAAIHEPYAVPPLLGSVPLVLAGHMHERDVRLDASGTRVMVEGSTGGAGFSSDSVHRITEGEPVPLAATLLYIARRGDRAGQVLAYDEITVGGFGLASVSLDRTVVRPETPVLAPGAEPLSTPSPGASPSPTASGTPSP